MNKVTKHFSALLAMILSITLMIGTIPTMLRASANPDDTVIWFVPDEQHQVIHTADAAGWWGASWGYQTTYSENGLHFSTKFPGTAVRTGYTQTFDLDGLTFVFDNLTNEQSKAIVTMLISDTTLRTFDPNMSENNMLEIVLDTVNGRLTLEGDTVLLEDEILKYNNITGKAFSIAFHKDGDGYKPTVDVEGTAVTGTTAFTSDMIAARSNITDESHIVVGIAGGDGSDGLTAFDLNKIGGVRKASVKGEKTLTVADFAHPVNYWPDRLALRDAPDGGARMLFYNSGITNIRNCLSDPAKLDGMYLKINNISVINASYQSNLPEIVFALADNDSGAAENMLALVLDTRNGKLRFSNDAKFLQETHVIISDEALKYENIAQREVVLRTFKNDDGSYKVQLEIEGREPLIGTLPASCIESATLLSNPDQARLIVTPAIPEGEGMPGKVEFMIDLVEFFSTPEGELDKSELDITRVPGVTYLDMSQLKIYGSDHPSAVSTREDWAGSGGLVVTNLKTGVRMAFSNAVANGHREGYSQKIALRRTELIFRRLKGGDFCLVFGNNDGIWPLQFDPNTLLLAYSATEKKIYAQAKDGTTADIITGLAPEILENNLFAYYFEAGNQGEYTLKVTAGETSFSGTIPANVIVASGIADFGAVEVAINPVNTGDSFTIDFIGVRQRTDIDSDITRVPGVTYLDMSQLKLYGSDHPSAVSTREDWAGSGGLVVTNLKTGVRMAFSNAVANGHREGYSQKIALRRTELIFRRLKGGDFCLVFGNNDGIWPLQFDPNTLLLAYSATEKKIYAQAKDGTTADIITGLAPEILENNLFAYYFEAGNQGEYTLKVTAGETSFSGTIPANVIVASGIADFGAVEVAINPVNTGDSFTIDFIGVRQRTDVAAVADVIDAIDAIDGISLENGAPIRAARKLYEQLNAEEREMVTNYNDLLKAEETYQKLAAEADSLLTYLDISNSRLTGEAAKSEIIWQTVFVDWANNFRASDIPTGGLHIEFTNAVSGHREGYKNIVDVSDLLLQFDNLDAAYPEKCKFAVLFGKDYGYHGVEYESHNPPLALVLDAAAGTITAYPRGQVIIQSDYLKLENLKGNRFSYQLTSRGEEKGCDLTVRTAGQELKGEIPYEVVKAATRFTRQTGCCIMVCPWVDQETDATRTFSLDFIGVLQLSLLKRAENTVALIDALPETITKNDIDAVKEAMASFQIVPLDLRNLIDNYDKLEKAVAQVYELEKEDTAWSNGAPIDETGRNPDVDNTRTEVSFHYAWLLLLVFSLTAVMGIVLFTKKRSLRLTSVKRGERQ